MNQRVRPAVFRISGVAPAGHTPKAEAAKTEGCLVCGRELVYLKEAREETCLICGRIYPTNAVCGSGHYVCDACHRKGILERVEAMLQNSSEVNPVNLAVSVFEFPGLNLHGPEYHSIVPAVLVTAYQNRSGRRDNAAIHEAIVRGKSVPGGSCGLQGNCGAGVGAGIAASILEEATPLSGKERGSAIRASALALLAISGHGGPRCCKRDAVTSIESFMKNTAYFEGAGPASYRCRQFHRNKTCIGSRCPYYPSNSRMIGEDIKNER